MLERFGSKHSEGKIEFIKFCTLYSITKHPKKTRSDLFKR